MSQDSSTKDCGRSLEELERDLAVALSANQALRESDAAHRLLFDGSPLPLLVDIDTGFGGAFNLARAVRSLIKAGAAGCLGLHCQTLSWWRPAALSRLPELYVHCRRG